MDECYFFPQKAHSSALQSKPHQAGSTLQWGAKGARWSGRRPVGPESLETALIGSSSGFSLVA